MLVLLSATALHFTPIHMTIFACWITFLAKIPLPHLLLLFRQSFAELSLGLRLNTNIHTVESEWEWNWNWQRGGTFNLITPRNSSAQHTPNTLNPIGIPQVVSDLSSRSVLFVLCVWEQRTTVAISFYLWPRQPANERVRCGFLYIGRLANWGCAWWWWPSIASLKWLQGI